MKSNLVVFLGSFAAIAAAFSLAVLEGANVAVRDAVPAAESKVASSR